MNFQEDLETSNEGCALLFDSSEERNEKMSCVYEEGAERMKLRSNEFVPREGRFYMYDEAREEHPEDYQDPRESMSIREQLEEEICLLQKLKGEAEKYFDVRQFRMGDGRLIAQVVMMLMIWVGGGGVIAAATQSALLWVAYMVVAGITLSIIIVADCYWECEKGIVLQTTRSLERVRNYRVITQRLFEFYSEQECMVRGWMRVLVDALREKGVDARWCINWSRKDSMLVYAGIAVTAEDVSKGEIVYTAAVEVDRTRGYGDDIMNAEMQEYLGSKEATSVGMRYFYVGCYLRLDEPYLSVEALRKEIFAYLEKEGK